MLKKRIIDRFIDKRKVQDMRNQKIYADNFVKLKDYVKREYLDAESVSLLFEEKIRDNVFHEILRFCIFEQENS